MEYDNSVEIEGSETMSESAKFWYTLLVPTLVSILVVFTAWVASYGALSQEVKGLREDLNSIQGSITPLSNNVRELGLIVAANTTELRVRFGGTNAKLFFYEGASSTQGLRPSWGDFPQVDEPKNCGYAELASCLGGNADVCEYACAESDRKWPSDARLQELFANKSTF